MTMVTLRGAAASDQNASPSQPEHVLAEPGTTPAAGAQRSFEHSPKPSNLGSSGLCLQAGFPASVPWIAVPFCLLPAGLMNN